MTRAVKSAIRVLEVLEFFDRRQGEATVTDIARELRYPQSSTSILLQNLAKLGYLQRGSTGKAYVPTIRVTLLGSWIAPIETPSGDILALMQELGGMTGETIILATLTNDFVRYVHVVPATTAMRLHAGPGEIRPLATSGAGRLFMSTMGEDRIRKIVVRHNAGETEDTKRLSMAAVRRDLAGIRVAGYALSLDRITPGAGVVFALLPPAALGTPHAIGIGGLSNKIKDHSDWYAQLIRKGIRRYVEGAAPRRARKAPR